MKNQYYIWNTIAAFIVSFVLFSLFFQVFDTQRTTTINLTDSTANFRSNRNNDGDEYYIIKNGDTLSKGVYFNQKWR